MGEDFASRMRLDGRVALVTGASRGLGWHFAMTLAGAGAKVAAAARRADKLAETVSAIEAAGGEAASVSLDVTDGSTVGPAFDAAEEALGPVDVVVNNAGIAGVNIALDVEEEEWDRVIGTNLRGAWLVAREAGRRMAERDGGTIINIASVVAERVTKGLSSYAMAKAGLVQMTKALALEWAPHGIRVNAIRPGYFDTDMNREYFASPPGKRLIERIPQQRLGLLEELDGALLFLASDAAAYVTGSVITVDGGYMVSSV